MARIGIVIYSLAGAGAERVSVNLAREFSALGHHVDFLLAEGGGEFTDEAGQVAELQVSSGGGASGWRKVIRQYITEKSPDVLLAMMEGAGVLAIQAASGTAVPVYVVSHIHFSRHCRQSPRIKERWLMPLAARWYLPKAAGVIGVSQGVSNDILRSARLKSDRVHTIYNPILSEAFYRKAAEPVYHPWFSRERNWLNVITVGRLTPQKDHATLLKAIALANKQRPVRLVIFGQGELLGELQDQAKALGIQDIVEFAGYDANPYKFISGADLFVLSSRWEGFGNVLVEALACGARVVSTNCPSGPREVLDGGTFGDLVAVGDSEAIADSITEETNHEFDNEALTSHLEKYYVQSVAEQYLQIMGLNTGGIDVCD